MPFGARCVSPGCRRTATYFTLYCMDHSCHRCVIRRPLPRSKYCALHAYLDEKNQVVEVAD